MEAGQRCILLEDAIGTKKKLHAKVNDCVTILSTAHYPVLIVKGKDTFPVHCDKVKLID